MNDNRNSEDTRSLAQERILDALLRALALEQPKLLGVVRSVLVDTEFTHPGKPGIDQSVHQQIQSRIRQAEDFAREHGADQG